MKGNISWMISVIMITASSPLFSQAPQSFKYQAAARDSDGTLLAEQSIGVRFTIRMGAGLTEVYKETHSLMTNEFGLFSAVVGDGITVSGNFSAIDWGADVYDLKVELNTGTGYNDMGSSQLLSVPYSLYSEKAGAADMSLDALNDVNASIPSAGQVLKWNGAEWTAASDDVGGASYTSGTGISISGNVISNTGDADADPGNEIQTLSLTGNQLSLSNSGGNVTLPTGTTYTAGTGIDITGNIISNSGDLSSANEIQNLSISGNTLSLSNGGGDVTLPVGATYSAGSGINISGNVISNTGDTNAADDLTSGLIAGGDLSGTYPNPVAVKLQGYSVSNNAPSPGQALKWDGTAWSPSVDNNTPDLWSQNGNDIYYNSGNVGINYTTPASKLHIQTDFDGDGIYMQPVSAGSGVGIVLFNTVDNVGTLGIAGGAGSWLPTATADDLVLKNASATQSLIFGTNNTERMRISSTGNIGIGTDSPQNMLQLYAAANPGLAFDNGLDYFNVAENSDGQLQFVANTLTYSAPSVVMTLNDDDFNVGIGTTSPDPAASLDLGGAIKIQGGSPGTGKVLVSDAAGLASWDGRFGFRAVSSTNQVVPGSTLTDVTFEAEDYDDLNAFNLGTETFTAPVAGVYHFDISVEINQADSDGAVCVLHLVVNGTDEVVQEFEYNTGYSYRSYNFSCDLKLAAGDDVKVQVFHNSSTDENVGFGSLYTYFSCHKLY